ncbi:CrcB family protein [Curtobacterium sp. MCBD17_019]|uniref:fluoride efflux transporter FluC n=1 Tax=Curtobacterium sp. MCBD17_019 TaxID=2175669 RepID=UPI000DA992F7|nr:CrcB family protein [Curtobacterium sp. MCBD17_019]PZE73687.1 CrcB family protein [Curtobacterium sp. MCBD17_019]
MTNPSGGPSAAPASSGDGLPSDPDVEVDDTASGAPTRPPHLRWPSIGLVALGGAVGTAARTLITSALPSGPASWPVLGINVLGAFCLGLLLEALTRRGSDEGRRRSLRLLFGTGVLGGFTTYSTLAVDAATLLRTGHAGTAVGYGLLSVVAGLVAVVVGLVVAAVTRPDAGGARR